MDDDNQHAVLEALARHHRRFAATFVVIALWFIALIAATWPWSIIALAAITILAKGARKRNGRTEEGNGTEERP